MASFDDFSHYLDNYKNQFIAEGINKTNENKSLLENSKTKLNSVFTELTIELKELESENRKLQKKINKMNTTIEKTKIRHEELEGEKDRLVNSDLGAVTQNENFKRVYKKLRIKMVLNLCLISLILIFLYNKEDVVQTIRSKLPAKTK